MGARVNDELRRPTAIRGVVLGVWCFIGLWTQGYGFVGTTFPPGAGGLAAHARGGGGGVRQAVRVQSSNEQPAQCEEATLKLRCQDIMIREAGLKDCWRLADFVLKGEPETSNDILLRAIHRERLDARLRYHIHNGVSIQMATTRIGVYERLVGIYASSVIDYIPIPPLPRTFFPPVCNVLPRRFLSDVKVADEYRRQGVAVRMLQHFEEEGHKAAAGVIGCLFVSRTNVPAIRLYEKAGFRAVYADFSRRQYRALLSAGAVGLNEIHQMLFMAKHLCKPQEAGDDGAQAKRQKQEANGQAAVISFAT